MNERIRFQVRQEHIDAAHTTGEGDGWREHCPVARALADKTGKAWSVGKSFAQPPAPEGEVELPYFDWVLSDRTIRFVHDFDAGLPVAPFTGEIRKRTP